MNNILIIIKDKDKDGDRNGDRRTERQRERERVGKKERISRTTKERGSSKYCWMSVWKYSSETGSAVIPSNGVCLCTRSN